MNPVDQSRRRRFRLIGGRGWQPLLAVVLIVLSGCESLGTRQQADPMLGIHAPSSPVSAPNAPTPPMAQAAAERTPPLPASYTAPGPAAVAVGETATPENARDLRMAGDAVAPPVLPAGGAARGVAPGVTVGNPEPAGTDSTSRLTPAAVGTLQPMGAPTPPPPGSTAANVRTFDEAQLFLKQHGVNWQRLDMEDDGRWKYECSIPNPTNSRMNRTYQTSRPFPDPLSAIRAVITQIEQAPR